MIKQLITLLLVIGVGVGIYYFSSFGSVSGQTDFDYYPPKQSTNALIILLHGGSWEAGDKWQLAGVGKYLAQQGLSVINANYRLAPDWHYDAPLLDIASIVKRVEADKAAYDLTDNYRMFVLGFSAGGHLATQFCLTEAKYGAKQVDGCIGLAGVYDLDRIQKNQDGPILVEAVTSFLGGGSPTLASPTYTAVVGEHTKFLLIRGENDTVVSPEQMKGFAVVLKEKQITVEELVVPDRDHLSIFAGIPLGDEVAQKILEFVR